MAFEIRNIGEALDLDTGQVITLTPDYIKQLDDETLAQFIYESKRFAKLPKLVRKNLKVVWNLENDLAWWTLVNLR